MVISELGLSPSIDTKSVKLMSNNVTSTKNKESILHNLVTDCITYRLSEKESLEYITTRYKKISRRHYFRIKKQILSDQELDDFFNHHARIGFVLDHKKRRDEMELVLGYLMKRWLSITEGNLFRFSDMTRLAETIIHVNQRAEDLSLSNSIIFKIKEDFEEANNEENRMSNELRELNPNLSQAKF